MEKRTYGEVSNELLEVTCKINKLQERQLFIDKILSKLEAKRNLLSVKDISAQHTIESYKNEKLDNDVLIKKLLVDEALLLTEVDSIVHELCPAN